MSAPTSIAGAAFLDDPALMAVVRAIEAGGVDRVAVVGGAVRNHLIGLPVSEVDLATTALPAVVSARAMAAGLKAVPTGIDHGTVTVVAEGRPFEVTTLRADVETDGRHAVVAFSRDFAEDARRRDFTMNAVYAFADGTLLDPVGGILDARARRLRFIGDPAMRIREDYLRILRFFRFHATYAAGSADEAGLAAAIALKTGLGQLSRERIAHELLRLLPAPRAGEAVTLMAAAGIFEAAIGMTADADAFTRYLAAANASAIGVDPLIGLAVLFGPVVSAGREIAAALRLSREASGVIEGAMTAAAALDVSPTPPAVRAAVYRQSNAAALNGLMLVAAKVGAVTPELIEIARDWRAPPPRYRAADLMAEGYAAGPELGRELRAREAAWIARDFSDSER